MEPAEGTGAGAAEIDAVDSEGVLPTGSADSEEAHPVASPTTATTAIAAVGTAEKTSRRAPGMGWPLSFDKYLRDITKPSIPQSGQLNRHRWTATRTSGYAGV